MSAPTGAGESLSSELGPYAFNSLLGGESTQCDRLGCCPAYFSNEITGRQGSVFETV